MAVIRELSHVGHFSRMCRDRLRDAPQSFAVCASHPPLLVLCCKARNDKTLISIQESEHLPLPEPAIVNVIPGKHDQGTEEYDAEKGQFLHRGAKHRFGSGT